MTTATKAGRIPPTILFSMLLLLHGTTHAFTTNLFSTGTRITSHPQVVSLEQHFDDSIAGIAGRGEEFVAYNKELGIAATMDFLWFTYRDQKNNDSMFYTTVDSPDII